MSTKAPKQKKAQTSLADALRELLLEGKVTTQEDICLTLNTLGHAANQSKVSRLLRKIGAVKSKNEQGQIVYRLPLEPAPPTMNSQLSGLVIDVIANETTIIVHTSPGSAQLIARVLDYHKDEVQILGTTAGDDTIFIAPKSVEKINNSIAEIRKLLF